MSRNRKRHGNSIEVASLTKWIVAAFFLGAAGLSYVYFKNQLYTTGTQIKRLEREVAALNVQDDAVQTKIAEFSSRAVIRRKLAQLSVKMIAIPDDRIVRMDLPSNRYEADIRPVSNREMVK